MAEKRVQFSNVVQNQVPAYVRDEFPRVVDFLKQYYVAQEYQGGPIDLAQNIDQYLKINETTNLTDSVILGSDIEISDTTISIDLTKSPTGTIGFPESYGIIKINDEIITYTGKTDSSFTGCVRGFVGVTTYRDQTKPEQLVFEDSVAADHDAGSNINNLSILFLKEFLTKTKYQLTPGFGNRTLTPNLNQNVFIKQSKDFYLSKGTDRSFEILFKALYNEDVTIVKPRDFLLTPSNADFRIVNQVVVEAVEGDPVNLGDSVLRQDTYGDLFTTAYAPITSVEKVNEGIGKTFYKLSIDAGYSRDIGVDGALYGKFSAHPKTQVISQVSSGSSIVDVDSTVGFPTKGELYVNYTDETVGVVSYTSKSLTQFYGCTNIDSTIKRSSSIGINTFAYGNSFVDASEIIKVRISSVLRNLSVSDNTQYLEKNDKPVIKTLGSKATDSISKNWVYNVPTLYKVKSLEIIDLSDLTYSVVLTTEHYFKIGDSITIIDGNSGAEKGSSVVAVPSANSITVRGQGQLNANASFKIRRNILKGNSSVSPSAVAYSANVQNVYVGSPNSREKQSKVLVSSPSIPFYNAQPLEVTNRSVTFSGTFVNGETELQITSTNDHGFYSGDAVYYTPEKTTEKFIDESGEIDERTVVNSSILTEGLYFVKRVSSTTIQLAKSRTDIYNSTFVSPSGTVTVTNNNLVPYDLRTRSLESQKLLREVRTPNFDGNVYGTEPGFTGVLVNGVEVANYKSNDIVYYGKINEIEVLAPGDGYDVLVPPSLSIADPIGTGATGYVAISGSLDEINLLDPGFDYETTPVIKITGGNGSGATASVKMKLITHEISFNSQIEGGEVNLANSTIGIGTYHKFKNAERIVYDPDGQSAIGGITTNSSYFVGIVNTTTFKLFETERDAISGINTVTFTTAGLGKHKIKSYNKKQVISSITVINSGDGYENKQRTVTTSGINTASNQISIKNHDYKSGEILRYTAGDSSISGLSDGSDYYVTKIDDNNFKLSSVGVGSTTKSYYYQTKQYLDLFSVGSGTHSFNYQPITVSVEGKIGISSVGTETFEAQIQPIFRGSVTSVHLSDTGVGYGSSEIVNFNRPPLVTLISGSEAQLQPIVVNGTIVEILVLNRGKLYNSTPNIILTGNGVGAVAVPVMSNGQVSSVTVLSGGTGYLQQNTFASIQFPGAGAELSGKVQNWRVNLFEKHFESYTNDDGFLRVGVNDNFGLQYSHLYAPRSLRKALNSVDQTGKILYGNADLKIANNVEVESSDHSPIIGWAYDGHPIYGPYGYVARAGGVVAQMKSGYKIDLKANRPPTSSFPEGFFVEDYTHKNVSDETVLDENNGRFCVTPEYPKGTYAYFATINTLTVDSAGPFLNFKRPVFPYLVGENYKGIPNEFNFKPSSNQDSFDLNNTDYLRNTDPYNLISEDVEYEFLPLPNNLKQNLEISSINPGVLERVGIVTGGNNYKVNDVVLFNEGEEGGGTGARAKVIRIKGKPVNSVSVASSSVSGIEFVPGNKGTYIAFSTNPHNFEDKDTLIISGLSTTSSQLEGSYTVGISSNVLVVTGVGTTSSGIGTLGATGIVTHFTVSGNLSYPTLKENDILGIGTEQVRVLNVDQKLSRIRVIRAVDGKQGVVGVSHTVTTKIYEVGKKLEINAGFKTDYVYRRNEQIYFNPSETVGLGTTAGVGIGSTLSFSNPGAGITEKFIPTKTLYIPGHELKTGDRVTYSPGNGSGLVYLENSVGTSKTLSDGTDLFVAKVTDDLIGLATVRVGLGSTGTFAGIGTTVSSSTTLFFSGIGTGVYHSLKTNHTVLTGELTRNKVTVALAQSHGILGNHVVFVDVNPSITTSFTVKYNDFNRRTLINPKDFVASGINTTSNTFTITDHGYKTGDKVVHTSTTSSEGLSNNKIYNIIRVDNNKFKLAEDYFKATQFKPTVVGVTSASSGTLSLINPQIKVYKDSTVEFDVSDSSLSYTKQASSYAAFELNFYRDKLFSEQYDKNEVSTTFDVTRTGTVGVTTDAKVTLKVNGDTPNTLYYRLDPVYESDLPIEKSEIINDDDVLQNNQVEVLSSAYSGTFPLGIGGTNFFTYTLGITPERSSYNSSTSILSYETNCTHTYGPISLVAIENTGKNYYKLPGFNSVAAGIKGSQIGTTGIGSGAVLDTASASIGKIKNVEIQDIGFNFQVDKTIRPSVQLPQVVQIIPLASFQSVAISSVGRGYSSAPQLLVFDGKTNAQVTDVDLSYTLGDNRVTILKNSYGMNNTQPTILPIKNSNGVGISTIAYNTTTKDATVTLAVGFSTINSFPFSVNDQVLIEGVSVGVGSTGKGFNSEAYDYKLFTIKSVTENLGGIGTVSFSLDGLLQNGEVTGDFNAANSTGRIINRNHFPIFTSVLKTINFAEGETVKTNSATGSVSGWDKQTGLLRISTSDDIIAGDLIVGQSSKSQGIASSVFYFESTLNTDTLSKVTQGWQTNSGYLNDNQQRVQDSLYYQNFSYSLRSKVDFDTWSDAVGSLNHTLGFKKFCDFQMESKLSEGSRNALVVGVATDLTSVENVNFIETFIDLNCVNDFDLVKENSRSQTTIVSDEISFTSKVLTDFFESVGNRVLSIDDFSNTFNSNPRPTAFSISNSFDTTEVRAQKYITYVKDRRFTAQRQLMIVDLLQDGAFGYINQYGRVETTYDQGTFDFNISGTTGQLQFFPEKSSVNDYDITVLSYNLDDNLLGVGTTGIGPVLIDTKSVALNSGSTSSLVSIAKTYSSVKLMVEITPDINRTEYAYDNINIVQDGTNVSVLQYGELTTTLGERSYIGYGTYHAYISGDSLNVDYIPGSDVGVGTTGVLNAMVIGVGNSETTGIGTFDLNHARLEGRNTTISSSGSPTENVIGSYNSGEYDVAHFIVQVTDITNNQYALSEVLVVDNYLSDDASGDTFDTEFGVIETNAGLGTIGTRLTGAAVGVAATVELVFTPPASVAAQAKVFMVALRHADDDKSEIDFTNGSIETRFTQYQGTDRDVLRAFELKHRTDPIFERYFLGADSSIVSVADNTIRIPNHFFVSGEQLTYVHAGAASTQAIGIETASFVGVGATDKVPGTVFAVKVDDDKIKLASTAENALKGTPVVLDFTSVGIGTSHRFVSTNQNAKGIIAIDNVIQSPIVSTSLTTHLAKTATTSDDLITVSTGINSIFGGDLLKIENEIVKVTGVGIGSTNAISVNRQWLGTTLVGHTTDSLVTKVVGNYNIVDNILNFVDPPVGQTPLGTSTNPPDERDWTGIATGSSFQGRIFLRSGVQDSTNETYFRNQVLDDISATFNGTNRTFTLLSGGENVVGVSTENGVILVNDVFQAPGAASDYTITESSGISSITFAGTATSVSYDVNSSNLPVGGVIVSVGMTDRGLGFQPLISAGGTSVISGLGTVSSISVGNTGSGYRASSTYEIAVDTSAAVGVGSTVIYLENTNSVFSLLSLLNTGTNCSIGVGTFIGIGSVIASVGSTFVRIGTGATSIHEIPSGTQAVVKISDPQIGIANVSVATSTVGVGTFTHVGYSTIIAGSISTTVTITNAGSGYTTSTPPYVVVDDPLSYSNIGLEYATVSSGVGTNAKIDVVVGQGSSIIDFTISNTGYGYVPGDVLTVPIGGLTGIPTTSSYREMLLDVQKTFTDEFSAWTLGTLQVLDSLDDLFDGDTIAFSLKQSGTLVSIRSAKGSKINVQDVLLVFINDTLQVPGEGYIFNGGSTITFTEAPKVGDTSKIVFYKGTGAVDVVFRDIIPPVKVGDTLQIKADLTNDQTFNQTEDPRTVNIINSTDIVTTNPYYGPGNTADENLTRPVILCRQTEDIILDETLVGKDRELYEPGIQPTAYIIKSVGIGSTVVYVDNIRPFFNSQIESSDGVLTFQDKITLLSQDTKIGAAATAIVSGLGTISSISISTGGFGYATTPTISIGNTAQSVGLGTTATATAAITAGVVTSITLTNVGTGYTNVKPPQVLISSPTCPVETNNVASFSGDNGIVVGFGTTTSGSDIQIVLDLHVPSGSFMRDASLVGTAVTLSGIVANDYLMISNSNIGVGSTSITSKDIGGNNIGIGTSFIDNIYQVASVSNVESTITGIGTTVVRRVQMTVTGFGNTTGSAYTTSNYMGDYSWGKINLTGRNESNAFTFYGDNGVGGISTSALVRRTNPLKFSNYTV